VDLGRKAKVDLGRKANVDPVLPKEVIQLQLPAADTVSIPLGQRKFLICVVLIGCAAILIYKEDNGFENSSRAIWPIMEVWV
jgi:hypothetical protein